MLTCVAGILACFSPLLGRRAINAISSYYSVRKLSFPDDPTTVSVIMLYRRKRKSIVVWDAFVMADNDAQINNNFSRLPSCLHRSCSCRQPLRGGEGAKTEPSRHPQRLQTDEVLSSVLTFDTVTNSRGLREQDKPILVLATVVLPASKRP